MREEEKVNVVYIMPPVLVCPKPPLLYRNQTFPSDHRAEQVIDEEMGAFLKLRSVDAFSGSENPPWERLSSLWWWGF